MPSRSRELLRKVATRQRLATLGVWFYRSALWLAAVYVVLLLCSRLLGLIPDFFALETLLIVPAVALLVALIVHRPPKPTDAARLVDSRMFTKDLFLTTVLLDQSPGEYKPLVSRDAEAKAGEIRPGTVVPFNWGPRTTHLALAVPLLLVGTILPQFDPFGQTQQRERLDKQREKLDDTTKRTKDRVKALSEKPLTDETSELVQKALEKLKLQFKQMKPTAQKANLNRLNQQQKTIGTQWRKSRNKKLNEAVGRKMSQHFGGADRMKTEKWKRDLAAGKSDSLKKEMEEIQELVKQLALSDNAVENQQLRNKIESRLQNLAEFLNSQASSKPMNAALARALEQLQTSRQDGLTDESLEALNATMDLSVLELETLAQSVRDMSELEKALETIGMAKQVNARQLLDGEETEQFQTLAEYAELYLTMISNGVCAACNGVGCAACTGPGMGGQGMGGGNIAPEDDTQKTGFKTEKSRSAIRAGKILLTLKTQEEAPSGEAREEYNRAMQQLKQGVSEAILQEQIPPGYHDAIKKYFDAIAPGSTPTPAPGTTESAAPGSTPTATPENAGSTSVSDD